VTYTQRAKAERNHALAAYTNPAAAARLLERFDTTERLLRDFPSLGRLGRKSHTRELLVADTAYLFVYRIEQDRVTVLEIRHSARGR
jgi:toxin ParE1/3/4